MIRPGAAPPGLAREDGAVSAPCPCGLPASYDACCGRWHRGEAAAPTAELLMRSRYSAFAVGDAGYVHATWDPRTRPARVELDLGDRWTLLEVLGATGGGLFDSTGTVRFRAHHSGGVVAEDSAFRREGGRWLYVGPAGDRAPHGVSDPSTTRRRRRS
jgi:SEC-C motif-containing protein